jgi:predicted nucleic acid-binding protein
VLAWARSQRASDIATTAVTEAELRYGLALLPVGRRREALAAAVEALFFRLLAGRVPPFDRAATPYYAEFVAARRVAGRPIATADAKIGAIARACGATALATRNAIDFEGYGVTFLNPWKIR